MKQNIYLIVILSLITQLVSLGQIKDSSKVESLFAENSSTQLITRTGIQVTNIQNQVSGMIGLSSGTYINQSFYVGFSGYVNLTHTKVNTGIFGVEIEQIFNQEKLIHYGYNLFAGVGTAKDYHVKNNLFDNFFNIFGTHFYFAQPSILLEINVSTETRLTFGFGYRFAGGLNENSYDISNTKLKNRELNSLSLFLNYKIFAD